MYYTAKIRTNPPPQGAHPGVLAEPLVQVLSVAPRCPDGGVPSPSTPMLADTVSEAVDVSTVQILLQLALKKKEEEKAAKVVSEKALVLLEAKEAKKREAKEAWSKLTAGFGVSDAERDLATWYVTSGFAFPSSSSSKRKRKKRRMRRIRRCGQ